MPDNGSLIIYDGDCIFCHNYARLMSLRASLGNVELIDARGGDPRVRSYWNQGYDLNTGMLFIHSGKVYRRGDSRPGMFVESSVLVQSAQSLCFFKPNGLDHAVPDLEAGTSDGTIVAGEEFDDPALS